MTEGLEIERVFLLKRMPVLPDHAVAHRIEQGYLPPPQNAAELQGRLRRIEGPDGTIRYIHTVKRGAGLVRGETEREIDQPTFEREWPRTERWRISKTRHKVRERDGLEWEIDVFDRPEGLVLAEVELDDVGQNVRLPPWLEWVIDREVTDDPYYTNSAIARRLGERGAE